MPPASRGWSGPEVAAGAPLVAAVFAWLHLLAAGIAAALLMAEYWLCRRMPDRIQVRQLGIVDMGYFLALITTLATGLARLLHDGQDPDYYYANRLFWLKITVFLAIGLVAVLPSLQYLRWNREARSAPAFAPLTREVDRVRAAIALGLGLWLVMPLLAVLVARGYGLPASHPWAAAGLP
jgi:putative membrane protein